MPGPANRGCRTIGVEGQSVGFLPDLQFPEIAHDPSLQLAAILIDIVST
jgi:hypothetical protein